MTYCYSYYSPLKCLRAARYVVFYYEQATDSFSTKIDALQIRRKTSLNLFSRFTCHFFQDQLHFYRSFNLEILIKVLYKNIAFEVFVFLHLYFCKKVCCMFDYNRR